MDENEVYKGVEKRDDEPEVPDSRDISGSTSDDDISGDKSAVDAMLESFRELEERDNQPSVSEVDRSDAVAKASGMDVNQPSVSEADRSAIFEKVKKAVVEQLDVREDEITESSTFVQDLGADSLEVVEIVMALEEAFGIEIPDEEVDKIQTVGDAVNFIASKTAVA